MARQGEIPIKLQEQIRYLAEKKDALRHYEQQFGKGASADEGIWPKAIRNMDRRSLHDFVCELVLLIDEIERLEKKYL